RRRSLPQGVSYAESFLTGRLRRAGGGTPPTLDLARVGPEPRRRADGHHGKLRGRQVAAGTKNGPRCFRTAGLDYCRQRPTLPHSVPCSTIGGSRLNFRVRNGNGCDPAPMTTGILGARDCYPSDVKERNAARTCGGPAPRLRATRYGG